ncbi:MAG: M28 family peptidase, partial [Bacteroidales bacterium]|nr:M28 family peptidase [Bacteroidales bacterium]
IIAIFAIILVFMPFSVLVSQNSIERIKKDVYVLASDSLMGRGAGTIFGDKASQYIYGRFIENGLRPNYQIIREGTTQKNVYCVIEGSDPILKNEFIVLGAHYDHLGYRIKNGDTIIYNGADDNASGTSLILELGRKINENKEKFKRSIVIIAFDSEETGLNGSYYFANSKAKHNDILISNNTKLMMSLDMVGFLKTSKELKIVGVGLIDNYSQYFKNSSLNNKYKVKFKDFDNSIFTGSDHDSFLKKNIPSFYVSTGLKSPYHKPEDDAQLIDYEGINDISNFFYEAVLNFANVEQIKPSKKSLRMKKPIPSNYYGFELAIGNNKHYYSGGRMTGKTDFAYGAGFFGKFELSNFFAIKTGVNYNYLGANRYESEVKYHSASIPILLSLKANTPNNDYEFSVSIGGFYSYIFDSRANINGVEQKNYLNKNVFGVQTEVEFRFRRFIYGYQFQRSLSNILTDPISNGKTNQITNNFKIGYVF